MSKQLSIFSLLPPKVDPGLIAAETDAQRREARARAAVEKRREEEGIRTLIDCWRLLKVPRAFRPEELRIVRLAWGGWELQAFWINEGFRCQVSGHPSVEGLQGPGFDAVEVSDLPGITKALIQALKDGKTTVPRWTADEKMWLRWLKARNDEKEGGSNG